MMNWSRLVDGVIGKRPSHPKFLPTSTHLDHSGKQCNEDEVSVAQSKTFPGGCHIWNQNRQYCCPKSRPAPLQGCHWVGKGDCAENRCNPHEVTVGSCKYVKDQGTCNCMYHACVLYHRKLITDPFLLT